MNSPFILTDLENKKYTVSWPTYTDIRDMDTKIALLTVLFSELQNDNIGLVLKFNVDELDIMWIDIFTWAQSPSIDRYMHDHYEIIGVAFNELIAAEKFKHWLEKKLVWQILND